MDLGRWLLQIKPKYVALLSRGPHSFTCNQTKRPPTWIRTVELQPGMQERRDLRSQIQLLSPRRLKPRWRFTPAAPQTQAPQLLRCGNSKEACHSQVQHPQEEVGLREWKPICAPRRPNSPGKAAPHRHRDEGANPPRSTAAPETTSREDNCREASRRRATQGAGPGRGGAEGRG